MITSLSLRHDGPFDLPLSLMAEASVLPPLPLSPRSLKLAVRVCGHPAIIEICQRSKVPAVVAASANISIRRSQVNELA
jgi:tRNA A37 threonylcarbamoyladenosine synthetase subunit TsaC/SUA5/YrdC